MKEDMITTALLKSKKEQGKKITMITAYDFPTAKILDAKGIDILLVGDSLGMVVLGYDSTLPVTMEDMIHHTKAVVRGTKHAMVIADMPFLSYQVDKRDAIYNAGRLIKEAGCTAVKVEGGAEIADTVATMVKIGIPVMGHLGLTPQAVNKFGGFKVQGKDAEAAAKIIADAKQLEKAGVFALVLECVPWQLAKIITEQLSIPVIGIGAGKYCDGQVLVVHDLLGLQSGYVPKFVKQYGDLQSEIAKALDAFVSEVENGTFPSVEQSYSMKEDEITKVLEFVGNK